MKITAYSFGKISIDNKSYSSDVIILPDKVIDNWWRREGHSLHLSDLEDIIPVKPSILIVGTGYNGRMKVPTDIKQHLENKGINVLEVPTGKAMDMFNQLQEESDLIVAALHLTC